MDKMCTKADLAAIDPAKTVHLVIDVQEIYFGKKSPFISDLCREDGQNVARRIAAVAPKFNAAGLAGTFWVYHNLVQDNLYLVEPEPQDWVFPKKSYSAFYYTPLNQRLKSMGADTLLISGGYTTQCVKKSVLDALELGFKVYVLTDCIQNSVPMNKSLRKIFNSSANPADNAALLTTSSAVLRQLTSSGQGALNQQPGIHL